MNIILLLASLLMVFCSFLSNKLKRKAFLILPDEQQIDVLIVSKPNRFNHVLFLGCLLVSLIYMALPFSKVFSPFLVFLILMFVFIITNMYLKFQKLKKNNVDRKFMNTSLQANIIVLIGLSIFAFTFLWGNYTWN